MTDRSFEKAFSAEQRLETIERPEREARYHADAYARSLPADEREATAAVTELAGGTAPGSTRNPG